MGNKGKLRFNIIDLLIISMVLALAVGGYFKFFAVNNQLAVQEQQIEYQILVSEVRQPTVDAYQVGQVLQDQRSNIVLGTITAKEVSPAKDAVPTTDGRLVLTEIPEKYNILFTLQSPAVVTENNITIGNKEIKIGQKVDFKTARAASGGVIFGLKVLK